MKWKPWRSASENAARVLPKTVEKYFKAGRKLAQGKRSPRELHQFRIRTKKFRYTLELFRTVYADRLERELEPVRSLQRVLGQLHDYHIIAEILEVDPKLQAELQRRIQRKLKEFHQQWATFDSEGELERWKAFLSAAPSGAAHSKRRARKGTTESARRVGGKFAGGSTKTRPHSS
jgi:CHAD domain-containing protein